MRHDCSYIFVDLRSEVIEARLSCVYTRKGKWHFAECPELQLIDQGESRNEAFDNLIRMAMETIIEALESGKMDAMMRELGFRAQRIPVPDRSIFRRGLVGAKDLVPLPINGSLRPLTPGRSMAAFGC